ncbi:MAG: hypothetical protein CMM45_11065 [Rhodospirillaceae bacterium]|nr:hypothetical protein [Rhodospirillaceae bacterium]
MPEGPGATHRRISLFSTFDLPFASIQIELAYPSELPRSRERTVFNVDASDFDAIAEAMLLPPVFKKVKSIAKGPLL